MKTSKKSAGFHVVELVLIVVAVAVLGFIGWRVYDAQVANQNSSAQTAQSQTSVPEVQSTSDLDDVTKTIDQINLDSSSSELSDLEKELDSL